MPSFIYVSTDIYASVYNLIYNLYCKVNIIKYNNIIGDLTERQMADISLHELNGDSSVGFETLSNDISKRLLQITTQLRSVDRQILNIQRACDSSSIGGYDEEDIGRTESRMELIDDGIEMLDEDIKELGKMCRDDSNISVGRYRDEVDGDEDDVTNVEVGYNDDVNGGGVEERKRQKQLMVVEKLAKGVNETRNLLIQMQDNVNDIKKIKDNDQNNGEVYVEGVEGDVNDNNISQGVVRGKVFQIQHTPLNAEQIEAQHYEAIQREAEISKIVNSVGELNQIFHDMNTLVSSQGELIDNIENNIYSTLENTRMADRQLRKADRWDRKRRRCSCVLMVVVVIVMFILLALIS